MKKLPWDVERNTRGQLSFSLADVLKHQDTNKEKCSAQNLLKTGF